MSMLSKCIVKWMMGNSCRIGLLCISLTDYIIIYSAMTNVKKEEKKKAVVGRKYVYIEFQMSPPDWLCNFCSILYIF